MLVAFNLATTDAVAQITYFDEIAHQLHVIRECLFPQSDAVRRHRCENSAGNVASL